jgi:hypothetical protein
MSIDLRCKAQAEDNVLPINLQKCSNWKFILLQSTDILIFVTGEVKLKFYLCKTQMHIGEWKYTSIHS